MSSMFEKYAQDNRNERNKSETFVIKHETNVEGKRTTLSLSLTTSDKKALKIMAAEKDTTIAAIIHEWIEENCK